MKAGALAGVSVDVTLYPLDTIKTRLQSQQGFYKAGGFRGVYQGNSFLILSILTLNTNNITISFSLYGSYDIETCSRSINSGHGLHAHYSPVLCLLRGH